MEAGFSRRGVIGAGAALALAAAGARTMAQDADGLPGKVGTVAPGLKLNDFVRRPDGVSAEAFADGWLNRVGPLLARSKGLRGLVMDVVDHARSPDAPYDGCAELIFEDEAAWDAAHADKDLFTQVGAAEAPIVAPGRMVIFTREVVIREFASAPPAGAVKRMGLVQRTPPMTHDAFVKTWRDDHAPEANAMPGLIRYSLNVTDERLSPKADRDGYAELWWESQAVYEADAAQRAADRAKMAAQGMASPTQPSILMIVQPHKLI